MLAQRTTQQMLRRMAAGNPSMVSQRAAKNLIALVAVSSSQHMRPVTTKKITQADSYQILVEQRKLRPTAPHLSIYKPQITTVISALNRITGCLVSGGVYIFGALYLVSPLFNWHFNSASMVAAFGAWPIAAKVATKFAIAFPFTFHSWSGLRRLIWDTGSQFQKKQVVRSGLAITGVSMASSLYLSLFV